MFCWTSARYVCLLSPLIGLETGSVAAAKKNYPGWKYLCPDTGDLLSQLPDDNAGMTS